MSKLEISISGLDIKAGYSVLYGIMPIIPYFRNALVGPLLRSQQMRRIVTPSKGLCGPTRAGMSIEKPGVKGCMFLIAWEKPYCKRNVSVFAYYIICSWVHDTNGH